MAHSRIPGGGMRASCAGWVVSVKTSRFGYGALVCVCFDLSAVSVLCVGTPAGTIGEGRGSLRLFLDI